MQVWNADETKMLTMAMTIPMRRIDPKGDIVVQFSRTPSPRLAPALKAYFYPGDVTGHEFVYGEEEARRISDETKTAVLSHDIRSGKLEGWESATIRLWDQGKAKPYTEPRATISSSGTIEVSAGVMTSTSGQANITAEVRRQTDR